MKKFLKTILGLALIVSISIAFAGCGKVTVTDREMNKIIAGSANNYLYTEIYEKYGNKTITHTQSGVDEQVNILTYKKNSTDATTITETFKNRFSHTETKTISRYGNSNNTFIKVVIEGKQNLHYFDVASDETLKETTEITKYIETYYLGSVTEGETQSFYAIKIIEQKNQKDEEQEIVTTSEKAYKNFADADAFKEAVINAVDDFNENIVSSFEITQSFNSNGVYTKEGNKYFANFEKYYVSTSEENAENGVENIATTFEVVFDQLALVEVSSSNLYEKVFSSGESTKSEYDFKTKISYSSEAITMPTLNQNYVEEDFSINTEIETYIKNL